MFLNKNIFYSLCYNHYEIKKTSYYNFRYNIYNICDIYVLSNDWFNIELFFL